MQLEIIACDVTTGCSALVAFTNTSSSIEVRQLSILNFLPQEAFVVLSILMNSDKNSRNVSNFIQNVSNNGPRDTAIFTQKSSLFAVI